MPGLQPLTDGSVLKILLFFFQSGSVIVFSIPEIILLSSTKQNIQDFNFGIIKQLLPSYEVNIEQSTLERLLWKTPPFPPLTLK